MRKISAYLGIIAAAAMTLVSCNTEIDDPNYVDTIVKEGIPFEIVANTNATTKTTINDYTISWAAGDAINLFYAEEGVINTFEDNGEFTIADADLAENKFKGTLAAAPVAGNYDWYAFYPYKSGVHDPKSGNVIIGSAIDGVQTQSVNSNTAHLAGPNYPLAGKATSVAYNATPSVQLRSLASFVKVNVTNTSGKALTVKDVRFVAPEAIVGTFDIDITGGATAYTAGEASNIAILKVSAGEAIPDGESAQFYLGLKPFTVSSGELKVIVNGYEHVYNITREYNFEAGKVKTVNFTYDNTSPVYEKAATITDGDYLIVYEAGEKAFDGSLATLDANNNNIDVVISGNEVFGNPTVDAAVFTITAIDGGYSIQNAGGKYIGQTSDNNGLVSGNSAYVNTISIENDGSATIVSGGAYLRYNSASNNQRFRYYKSSSYSNQKPIALYRKIDNRQDATLSINGTIPTDPMAKDDTFEFSVTTNSDAAPTATLSPDGAATIEAKLGSENTWIVTAGEPIVETEVTLTVSVAGTATYKAASDTRTFTVLKKNEVLDFNNNVEFEVDDNDKSYKESAYLNGEVDPYEILKLATSSAPGTATIYVPSGSTELTLFALAWNGKSATIVFEQDGDELESIQPASNAGVANSSPYTIDGVTSANQYTISLTSDNPITVSAAKNNRAIIFGVKGNGGGAINKPDKQTQLSFASANVELQLGGSQTITATVDPNTAAVTYSSSAPTIVSVDENTGTITPGGSAYVGASATITATVVAVPGEYTGATASYTVTIIAAPTDPMEAAETVVLPYTETFLSSIGKFDVYDEVNNSGSNIWTQSSQYGMVAKAFINSEKYATTTWLYSPDINLGSAVQPTLTFSHAGRYLGAVTDVSLWIRESGGEWAQVAFSANVTNSDFTFVDNSIDLSSHAGETIQVAFKYTSTTANAGTYEVKNFKVMDTNAPSFSAEIDNNSVVAASGGTKTITVTGNVAWTASATNGASVAPNSGNGAGSITVTIPENTDTNNGKSYVVTVSPNGFDDVVFNISQSKATTPGDKTWKLVTDASSLTAGDLLIIVSDKGFVAGDISNSIMASVAVTISNNEIATLPGEAVQLTLGGSAGAWTLANSADKLLGATAAKKVAWDSGTTTWSISIDGSGNATIQNGTDSYGKFLYNVNSPRFTTYTSSPTVSMVLPQIYCYN